MPELAYLNGKIMPIEDAMVPIEDRGYQFGDAVYEYVASYNGRLFCAEEHLDRLERSMQGLAFPPVARDDMREALNTLFDQAQIERAGIYIQISRGVAPRNHPFPEESQVQIVMTIRSIPEVHPHAGEGAATITMKDFRWSRCDIKTVQLLPNVLAKQKALDAGVYDTIFITEAGVVREATSSNVFIIQNGKAVTHPLTPNILPGITRMVIIDICKTREIPLEERFFSVEELYQADEVFLCGTVTDVLPIIEVDGKKIGAGKVGPLTRTLYGALRQKALA